MAKFAFLCTLSFLSFVQSLLSSPKTPTRFTLKRTSTLLAEKSVYPPVSNCRARSLPPTFAVDTERKHILIESKIMLMEAKVLRIENTLSTILEVLLKCDDRALLEKYTCSAVIYNEGLTKTRPLRLLRSELRTIQDKFMKISS